MWDGVAAVLRLNSGKTRENRHLLRYPAARLSEYIRIYLIHRSIRVSTRSEFYLNTIVVNSRRGVTTSRPFLFIFYYSSKGNFFLMASKGPCSSRDVFFFSKKISTFLCHLYSLGLPRIYTILYKNAATLS